MTDPAGRYALAFRPAALRALRKLDRQIAERIKAATEALRDDPLPSGAKMLTARVHMDKEGHAWQLLEVTTGCEGHRAMIERY